LKIAHLMWRRHFTRSIMKNLVTLNVAFISFCNNVEFGWVTWPIKDVFHMSHAPCGNVFNYLVVWPLQRKQEQLDLWPTTITSWDIKFIGWQGLKPNFDLDFSNKSKQILIMTIWHKNEMLSQRKNKSLKIKHLNLAVAWSINISLSTA